MKSLLGIAICLSAILAGCGSGRDSASTTRSVDSTTTTTVQATTTTEVPKPTYEYLFQDPNGVAYKVVGRIDNVVVLSDPISQVVTSCPADKLPPAGTTYVQVSLSVSVTNLGPFDPTTGRPPSAVPSSMGAHWAYPHQNVRPPNFTMIEDPTSGGYRPWVETTPVPTLLKGLKDSDISCLPFPVRRDSKASNSVGGFLTPLPWIGNVGSSSGWISMPPGTEIYLEMYSAELLGPSSRIVVGRVVPDKTLVGPQQLEIVFDGPRPV